MDTNIPISPDLIAKIEREADARGMSIPEYVRDSLEWVITQRPSNDPLFTDTSVFKDDGPVDIASNHDDYLYGDAS